MSDKLKNSKVDRIDRPFDPEHEKRARQLADRYQIIIRQEDGEYYGRGLELPLVMSDGKTAEECIANTREAMAVAVATMLELGELPPPAAEDLRRTEQVNIRLSLEEKILLEATARRKGCEGLSDYMRMAAIEGAK